MGSVQSVAVVGAGMVGLATAWHLQEHGVQVTVLDREGVAAGASWGNAGWLTPAFVAPLPEPALLRYGLRALVSPKSPVYAPLAADRNLARFMAGFLRHSTHARWQESMRSLLPLVREALPAFDHLRAEGVSGEVLRADPVVAAFPRVAQAGPLTDELEHIAEVGGTVAYELVSGQVARRLAPVLADSIQAAVLVRGQRFINPVTYVHSLADAVRARGGSVVEGAEVVGVRSGPDGVVVEVGGAEGSAEGGGRFDAVVVATGAWLGRLCAPLGVTRVVQAGRGYSFSVAADPVPEVPVYLPTARVAVTPLGDRVRVAGMMELRRPDARFDHRRVTAIVDSVRPLLQGVDLDSRRDEWVGSRPVTIDGLPLIGATEASGVFVAGGHGMWGVTLGPVTGRLLAEQVVTGRTPDALRPFDPLR
ncbi:FAD-binding oxidoreductase [Nostocoides sp. F2B08]|uniref:NAD(P)/FAD-dependent oxidoreductase n=1 Tax=Nostocoides sp. F2B08 TaxID=2653936 RepID=UPI001D05BA5C|nr:FAD-dependent oxidoreductase [Tetrasphaera sp. F2B08]